MFYMRSTHIILNASKDVASERDVHCAALPVHSCSR